MVLRWDSFAKKYATAFLNVNKEHINNEIIEKFLKIDSFIKRHKQFLIFLNIPTIPDEKKLAVIEKICHHLNLSVAEKKLFTILLHNKQIDLLDRVFKKIVEIYRERNNTITCKISSSHALSEDQKNSVIAFIEKGIKKDVIASFSVDENLLCGLKIKSLNYVWEHSGARLIKDVEQSILRQVGL